jgi:L-amino acid N-acyltransferase YncA
MNLRLANTTDLPQIRAIYNEAILNSNAVYDEKPKSEADMQLWFDTKQQLGMPIIVIDSELNNEISGYGSFGQFRPWEGFRFCAEHALYVHTKFRGQGLGHVLLEELMRLAKANNFKSMVAGIDSANGISIQLHKKKGFEEVGTFKNAGFKKGMWLDLTMLQKQL